MSEARPSILAAEAADIAADSWLYTPSGRLARLRCERIFAAELAAARQRNNPPTLSRCPITGAKTVTFPSAARAVIADTPDAEGAGHDIPVFNLGGAMAAIDMPYYADLARAKAMKIHAEGWTARQLNAAAVDAALSRRVECEGPQLDFDAQIADPESDPLAAPVGMFADYWEGEADLRDLARNETGRILSVEAAEERFAAFRLQCEQTERIARACEDAGMMVFCVDPSQVGQAGAEGRAVRPALTFVPVGEPEKAITMPNVQRLNAFPSVAASRRANDVRSLRYWFQNHNYTRMATITAGTRYREDSKLENINAENKKLHRAIGELVRHQWFKAHGQPVALGMEFGTPAPFMGDWHLHHHGHLLWEPVLPPAADWRRYKKEIRTTDADGAPVVCRDLRHPEARLARFRRWLRLRMAALLRYDWREKGFRWRERDRGIWREDEIHAELGKRIQNAHEACKYPIKPGDLDVLLDEAGPQAVRTYVEGVKGLRLFTAYGEFKKLRARVKNEGRRFVPVSTPDGKIIEIRRNWNLSGADIVATRQRAARKAALRRKLSPEVTEKRRRRALRQIEARARRPIFRLYRIHQAETRARAVLAGSVNVGQYTRQNAILAACAEEKAVLHRELRDLLENVPHSLQATGVSDQIAAPWLADFRTFLSDSRAFSDATATSAHIADENAGKTTKKTAEKAARRPIQNRLIARTAPFASGRVRITQTHLAVFGYTGDFAELRAQDKRVGEIADATAAHIAAALRAQARLDALPPERPAPAYNAPAPRHARPPARVRGSHYPHNSQEAAESWPPTPDLWAEKAEKQALAGAKN